MTRALFRSDAYLAQTPARVLEVRPAGEKLAAIIFDQTLFYAQGGGQAGDSGTFEMADGRTIAISNAVYDADRVTILHLVAPGTALPEPGAEVFLQLNWPVRLSRMKIHTAMHLLTAVLPWPVTGGAVGDGEGRLDFDIPLPVPGKDEIAEKLNAMIARDALVRDRYITDEEMLDNPGLIKTMSVKPPMGLGKVRLVEIEGLDLQPCGGTHVARTGEIGRVLVTGVENKGKLNRRVRVALGWEEVCGALS